MGTCFSCRRRATSTTSTPPWSSDLPPELAGVVLRWLPSHADRVRFAAVCRNWRVAAQQQGPLLPPPLPWVSYNNTVFHSLCDREVHQLSMQRWYRRHGDALGCYSTFGGWILLEMDDPARSCFLRNPFSGTLMKLPSLPAFREPAERSDDPYRRKRSVFRKVVVSAGIVAGLFEPGIRENPRTIGICQPLITGASWVLHTRGDGDGTRYEDVAFFHGNIYAVDNRGNLYAFDLATDDDNAAGGSSGRPVIKVASVRCVIQQAPCKEELEPAFAAAAANNRLTTRRYLVVSSDNDRLLMVRWSIIEVVWPVNNGEPALRFSVFQADEYSSIGGGDAGAWVWTEVTTTGALEDQALFVSRSCSVAVPASGYRYLAGAEVRGGRVFYLEDCLEDLGPASHARFLRGMGLRRDWSLRFCGVYDLRPTDGRGRLQRFRLWTEDRGDREYKLSDIQMALLLTWRATWFLPHAGS